MGHADQEAVIAPCAHCGMRNRFPRERMRDSPVCGNCKLGVLPDRPIAVTDASFTEEVEAFPLPVLVDFWAPWCAPCRMMEAPLEQLARQLAARLKVAKVNVDDNPDLTERFGIRSIPSLLLLRDGATLERLVGAVTKSELEQRLAPHLVTH